MHDEIGFGNRPAGRHPAFPDLEILKKFRNLFVFCGFGHFVLLSDCLVFLIVRARCSQAPRFRDAACIHAFRDSLIATK